MKSRKELIKKIEKNYSRILKCVDGKKYSDIDVVDVTKTLLNNNKKILEGVGRYEI